MKPLKDWTLQEVKEECIKNREDGYAPTYRCCHCRAQNFCIYRGNSPDSWGLISPPQREEIEWHKYPEDKPKKSPGYYLVTTYGDIYTVYYDEKEGFFAGNHHVTAWAEMPKGYQEETE